jgi:hypothetical protein
MSNFNYVSPVKFQGFGQLARELNAEQLAAAQARLKNREGVDKRRQEFADKINGINTTGWADLHRDEFRHWKNQALTQIATSDNVPYAQIADALMEFQYIGDGHAKVYAGHNDYTKYLGPEAENYTGKLDFGRVANHSYEDLEEKDEIFNTLGLVDYNDSTRIGLFRNPDHDPEDENSPLTMKDKAIAAGETIQTEEAGPNIGKQFYVDGSGQKIYVSGAAFDADAFIGNQGIYATPTTIMDLIAPNDAYKQYKTESGGAHFSHLGAQYARKVKDGKMSEKEAIQLLKQDFLTYVTPEDKGGTNSIKALEISAIELFERDTQTDYNEDGNITEAVAQLESNDQGQFAVDPWEHYVNKMIESANIFGGSGDDGSLTAIEKKIKNIKSVTVTRPDNQFKREFGNEEFNWEQIGRYSTSMDNLLINVPVGGGKFKVELKDDVLKDGVKVRFGQTTVKYDQRFLDSIEVFDDDNVVVLYSAGPPVAGDPGLAGEVGEPGDPWRYNEKYSGGKSLESGFIIIDLFGEDGEYSDEFTTLIDQFGELTGNDDFLLNKIRSARK